VLESALEIRKLGAGNVHKDAPLLIRVGPYLVTYSLSSLKTDRMLALVVVISLLGLALDHALVALRNRLVYWEKLDTFYV